MINKEELTDGRFWSCREIEENLGKNIFTPNLENEYRTVLKIYQGGWST